MKYDKFLVINIVINYEPASDFFHCLQWCKFVKREKDMIKSYVYHEGEDLKSCDVSWWFYKNAKKDNELVKVK